MYCASFHKGYCITTPCHSGNATKETSYRTGTNSFEKKITSTEDMLITETEHVLKEIYNFMGTSKQIPLTTFKNLLHLTSEIQAEWPLTFHWAEYFTCKNTETHCDDPMRC